MIPNRGKVRVLVAEDNPVNQKLATLLLQQLGCSVDVAKNGLEVILACDQARYDLILMDCYMPEVNGYEATREVRARETGDQRTPIIALTANAQQSDRKECLDAGMDDFLTKPIHERELTAILERWVIRDDDVLTPAAFDNLRGLNDSDAVIREVAGLYLSDTPMRIDALRRAVQKNDAAALATAAHGLKGSSANVGAMRVYALAAKLEEMGRRGDLTGVSAMLDELSREYERATRQLQAMAG